MTQDQAVRAMLDRLLAIPWRVNDSRIQSHLALLQEYLRRSALWAKTLACTEDWPFFDVSARIEPSVRADPKMVKELMDHLTQFNLFSRIKQSCEWSLHWAAIKDMQGVKRFAPPDPYEPLVVMYERGGTFTTEHGFFCVSVASFRRGVWSDYDRPAPIVALDEVALDRLDGQ